MEEKEKRMMFGRRYDVGSFTVIKFNRVLRRQEVEELRKYIGIPRDERKNLQRARLPYVKVEASSGLWAVEFCCGTTMYAMIDRWLGEGGETQKAYLNNLFLMMFTDTTCFGDDEFVRGKAEVMQAFLDRVKAKEVSDEEDAKTLEELRTEDEAMANIVTMAADIDRMEKEGGGA